MAGSLNGDDPSHAMVPGDAPLTLAPIRAVAGSEFRETVRLKLEPGLDSWIRHTLEGVEKNERSAMNRWGAAMGLLGSGVEVNVALVVTRELGCSISEAKRKCELIDAHQGISDIDAMTQMEQHLRDFYRARGKRLLIVDEDQSIEAR